MIRGLLFFSISSLVFSFIASAAQTEIPSRPRAEPPSTAEVNQSVVWDLYVKEFVDVKAVDVKSLNDPGYGVPGGTLNFAAVDFTVNLLPENCDTFFLNGQILASQKSEGEKDQNIQVELGTVVPMDAFSTCVGVPARKAHFKLTLVNGIGEGYDQDRMVTFHFKGKRDEVTGNPHQWLVPVRINQVQGKVELLPIVEKNDRPVIPDTFQQKISCDFSGRYHATVAEYPSDDTLTFTVTKTAGDAKEGRNYSLIVQGVSKSVFGDANPHQENLSGSAKSPWPGAHAISFEVTPADPQAQIQSLSLELKSLGWVPKAEQVMVLNLAHGGTFGTCLVTDVSAPKN